MPLDSLVVGRIATPAGERGFVWAEAIGISSGRVVATGRPTDVEALAGGSARRLALADDEVALSALTDGHMHLVEAARAVNQGVHDSGAVLPGSGQGGRRPRERRP